MNVVSARIITAFLIPALLANPTLASVYACPTSVAHQVSPAFEEQALSILAGSFYSRLNESAAIKVVGWAVAAIAATATSASAGVVVKHLSKLSLNHSFEYLFLSVAVFGLLATSKLLPPPVPVNYFDRIRTQQAKLVKKGFFKQA